MILIYIGIALLTFIAFGAFKASGLTEINIRKSVTIDAPQQEVFDMVRYLRNFPKWSPFLAQDPDQQYRVEGNDGVVGAKYHWEGNKGKDLGFQEIVEVKEYSFVGMQCDIQKPFKANPTFDYTFKESDKGVLVTQDFQLKSSLVNAFFMWLFGAKKEMEKTNAHGLKLLKKAIESSY